MMGTRERLSGGAEWDAFSRYRRVHISLRRPRAIAAIKAKFWRRVRRVARLAVKTEGAR